MITVIDSIMGAGKTTWAFQHMKENTDESYIYCTPFLPEIDRVQTEFENQNRKFHAPKQIDGKKINGFNELLMRGCNVAVTHKTFSNSNSDTLAFLEAGNYTLVLDEVLDILIDFNDVAINTIKKGDIKVLFNEGFIKTDKYGKVYWLKNHYPDARYSDVERIAKNGNLFYLDKTLLVWQFPPQIFKMFKNVYILTYMFNGSFLKPYFQYHDIHFEVKSIINNNGNREIVPFDVQNEIDTRKKIKELITINEQANINDFKNYSLSKNWYESMSKKNKDQIKQIKNNTANYFKNIIGAKSAEIMWTIPKDYRNDIQGRGYTSVRRLSKEELKGVSTEEVKKIQRKNDCFVVSNARATNDFKDRSVLAYLCNIFPNPYVTKYFSNKNDSDGTNIKVNLDAFSLSCMLQWIWRSRIRDGQPVDIYIPSTRMRTLLKEWLNGKEF